MNHRYLERVRRLDRQGAMLILVCVMLMVLLAIAAFSVDVAYMQLTQSELRAASDAAAKAAARELSLTDGDVNAAIAAGKTFAQRNSVAGTPLTLVDSDFEFGDANKDSSGKWIFENSTPPYSAVRVTADKSSSSASGNVRLFFGSAIGTDTFSPQLTSTASYSENEIILAIDRSHSMAFDKTGNTWSYPAGIPVGDTDEDGNADYWFGDGGGYDDLDGDGKDDNYDSETNTDPNYDYSDDALLSPPHPSLSRWASLESAIQGFLTTFDNAIWPPKVGVVSWASYLDESTYESILSGKTFPATVREIPLGRNYPAINAVMQERGSEMMLGGTDIAAGIDESVAVLLERNSPAKKTIILMTDGQQTAGRPAIAAATDANAAGIVVHVITFLDGDQSAMSDVAAATGGRHIHASNQQELIEAFIELARLLPVALID